LSNTTKKWQLIDYATDCIKPAIAYFTQKFECDLKEVVAAFNDKLEDLKEEHPSYVAVFHLQLTS